MNEWKTEYDIFEAAPAVLEASSEAIATIDSTGQIKGTNSRFLFLLNISHSESEKLNIQSLFREIDFSNDIAQYQQDNFEPAKLTKMDGTESMVLLKIVSVGKAVTGYKTVLIQDPEAIRRIIDRLDYIETYDIATGLLNRRKGLVEFEQLQASNLSGGCFLVRLENEDQTEPESYRFIENLKTILSVFNQFHAQHLVCRYSFSELLFVIVTEDTSNIPQTFKKVLDTLKSENKIASEYTILMAYENWSGAEQTANDILDQLKVHLTPLASLKQLKDCRVSFTDSSETSFLATLQKALQREQFEFFIQPQISSDSRQVVSGELLIRWIPSEGNIIPPSQFVAYLEEGDFAGEFLEWSIVESAKILLQVYEAVGQWVPLSLNVATTQFNQGFLLESLHQAFTQHQVPFEYLEIEITERILAEDPQQVLTVLKDLQDEGFKVAIDDFGTGYSSLSYLRQFPLDRLKIDQVFIANLEENEEDRLISTAIANLAHVLGLEVVVEGIENPPQAAFMQNIGCEYFQGYLTGKPMSVVDFIEFCLNEKKNPDWLDASGELLSGKRLDDEVRKVTWKKSFTTDVVSVDQEHRELIDALNYFSDSYLKKPESINFLDTIDLIGGEAIKHFEHEEQVMANIGYPRYEIHREKHKWLIADLSKRRAEIEKHPKDVDFDELLKYLKYWLLRHLISEDTHLHRFINKSNSERRIH